MYQRTWNAALAVVRLHPLLFFPLIRLRMHLGWPQLPLLTRHTELVIEGYWRSANTFSAHAFALAQERPVQLAYHTHAAATVIQAVRWQKPTLVLIRAPLEAITSRLLLHPHVTAAESLREYIWFYQALQAYQHDFVTATFEQITADFGHVIHRVNERFGTPFALFSHTPDRTRHIVEETSRGLPEVFHRPQAEQQSLRAALRQAILRHKLFAAAEQLHDAFLARACADRAPCQVPAPVHQGTTSTDAGLPVSAVTRPPRVSRQRTVTV
jgi:hypothetical protein